MFVPLHDRNSLKHIRLQYVTWLLIAVNVIVYLLTTLAGPDSGFAQAAMLSYGFIPSVVNDLAELPPEFVVIPETLSYVTYAFLHADILHLGSNMLFLWVFGDNVEDALGHIRFLAFYLICAAAGAAAHNLLLPASIAPLIGASGAVAGVISAYLILHPRVRVWILVLGRIPLPLPAYIPLLFWIGMQVYMVIADPDGEVSWATHLGGILAGAVLVVVLRRRSVPLFDRALESPRAVVHTEGPPPLPGRPAPSGPPPLPRSESTRGTDPRGTGRRGTGRRVRWGR
ncbi:rhomboid family intramembrane serine protease [Pseudohoeflea coraliihabitans]|uniref:Rhomboid family intramembrane serine protease n=1 Tax=Pseudohoeflea coraliihabitans TaxID=2860393 RepID=A0ABS6WN28_9HYPH|nr:rhomboid family intramembrane serine protease [Pseudohoeflea sp. DP4N28-3]MBW3096510.1 rhomboid family intramembrane serine protease [Pseudohoeflea sp. DP4N28-3]